MCWVDVEHTSFDNLPLPSVCTCHLSARVSAGAVPLLVLCVQEPELSLKRVAASALSDIAKHTPELAQVVVDTGAVPYLAPLLVNQDAKLKRQVSQSARGRGRAALLRLHHASTV